MRILAIISSNSFSLICLFSSPFLGHQWHQYLTNEWGFLRLCSVFSNLYLIWSYWIILCHLFSSSLSHSSLISIMPLGLFCELFTLDYCIFQFQNVHLVVLSIYIFIYIRIYILDFLSFFLFKEYLLLLLWTFFIVDTSVSWSNNFNVFVFFLSSANGLIPWKLRFFFSWFFL